MTAIRPVVRSALGGLAFGGFLYLVGDTASDYLTFSKLRASALELAQQDEELQQLVGQPFTTGMWYNSTLGFSHRHKVAHCTFQLRGSHRVTDIAVKAGRQQGPHSTVLYNLIGPGSWRLISCQAMVPSAGGLVEPRSLLPEHREEQRQKLLQQQQMQQQQGQAPAGSSSKWRLWPWARRSSSSSSTDVATPGAVAHSSAVGSGTTHAS